jgi:hypothetical protein
MLRWSADDVARWQIWIWGPTPLPSGGGVGISAGDSGRWGFWRGCVGGGKPSAVPGSGCTFFAGVRWPEPRAVVEGWWWAPAVSDPLGGDCVSFISSGPFYSGALGLGGLWADASQPSSPRLSLP